MQETFAGRRVTVMGLGTFGGGIAAARFLGERGAAVTVTDLRGPSELAASLESLADLPALRFRLGGHDEADFTGADLVVVSPAVKPGNPLIALARQAGVPVTSELRLFWERCPARIVGVTGSNGKSMTATLIHRILRADGRRAWLGGNIGRSLLADLDDIQPEDWVVLELSSFQLADLDGQQFSPHVAVVTNFTPNHLDWHGSVEAYAAAKTAIFRWQKPDDVAVRHTSGVEGEWPAAARAVFCEGQGEHGGSTLVSLHEHQAVLSLSQRDLTLDFTRCPGLHAPHQQSNAVLAAATGLVLNADPGAIAAALESFPGIPHRLQVLGECRGRRFVNDSASTTPESTIAALDACGRAPVLIVGGSEKGCGLRPLAQAIASHVAAAIVIGDVQDQLAAELDRCLDGMRERNQHSPLKTIRPCDTLSAAVDAAADCSSPGDTILFSPGFSSRSMFRHFADRGRAFIDLVRSRGEPTAHDSETT